MANELTHLRADGNPIGIHVPAPAGMSFEADIPTKHLQLRLPTPLASRFRMVFGYLGELRPP